jgi:predicted Zn-dependent peptidase
MLFSSRLFSSALLLISLLFAPAVAWAAENVTSVTLPNGLRVITAPSHTVAITSIDVWVRAGTRRQPIDQQGVAHFLEHLLFKGTPTRPSETQIDGAIEDLGGSLDAATSYDWAHFYTVVPSSGFSTALDVLADALQHANISSDAVENERAVIINEIARHDDSHINQLLDEAHALSYPDSHPYHFPVMGTSDDVQNISRQQILDFYHTYYVPNNVTVVITGDITSDQALAAAQKEFGSWKFSASLPADNDMPVPPLSGIQRHIDHDPAEQTYLMMAFPAPSVKDQPDVWTMDVLMTLLGQGAGSLLDTDLHRKRHLVTAISADFLTQRDAGLMTISATLPTGDLENVESAILKQIDVLRAGPVSDDDLAAAKQMLMATYLFDAETDSGRADSLGFYDSIDTFEYDNKYVDRLEAVTAADLQRVAQKYLTPDSYTLVALVPPADAINAAAPKPTSDQVVLSSGPKADSAAHF